MNETTTDRNGYYIVVPFYAINDKRLTHLDLLMLGLIANLSNQYGYCFATNNHFCETFNRTQTTVSKSIANLIKYEYLKSIMIQRENYQERHLILLPKIATPPSDKSLDPLAINHLHNKQTLKANSNNTKGASEIEGLHEYFLGLRRQYGHSAALELTDKRKKLYGRIIKAYGLPDMKQLAEFRFDQLKSPDYRHYQVPETVFRVTKIEEWLTAAKSKEDGKADQLYTIY